MAPAKSDHPSPWLKRVLIPFWALQLLLMLVLLILFIATLASDPQDFAVYILLMLIVCAICIVLDVTEIVLFARRKLQPLTYLVFQSVKTAVWFALFMVALVHGLVAQQNQAHPDTTYTYGAIIFGVLFAAFLGTLIYASIIYHRHRRSQRKALNGNNFTQNPYYNAPPYGEDVNYNYNNGPRTAQYQPFNSPFQTEAGTTTATAVYESSDGVTSPCVESGGEARMAPELAGLGRGGGGRVGELPTEGMEVYELGVGGKSMRSSRQNVQEVHPAKRWGG